MEYRWWLNKQEPPFCPDVIHAAVGIRRSFAEPKLILVFRLEIVGHVEESRRLGSWRVEYSIQVEEVVICVVKMVE